MFQVGQKVECIKRDLWCRGLTYEPSTGPSCGEVLEITDIKRATPDIVVLSFPGWPSRYDSRAFRAITEDPKAVKRTMRKHFNKYLKEGVSA